MNGSHHAENVVNRTGTVRVVASTCRRPAASHSSARCPSRAPARAASSGAAGSTSCTAAQNAVSGPLPPAWSQTHAATRPPGRVTRAISASPRDGVGHEVHDELGDGAVEGVVGEGKPLRAPETHVDAGTACPDGLDERGGRVHRRHRGRAETLHQPDGQGPGSAPHVERVLAGAHLAVLQERHGQRLGEPPHEPVVGVGRDVEGHRPNIRRSPRRTARVPNMAGIVLRVRMVSGDNLDVSFEDPSLDSQEEVVDRVVATLAEDCGVLRCRHGGRLLVLYARGVAAVEVAPRGAVL